MNLKQLIRQIREGEDNFDRATQAADRTGKPLPNWRDYGPTADQIRSGKAQVFDTSTPKGRRAAARAVARAAALAAAKAVRKNKASDR